MGQLIEVQNGKVFCDSQMVAEKFGRKHAYVKECIDKLIIEDSKIFKGRSFSTLKNESANNGSTFSPLNFKEIEREYRGQKFKVYLMDREAFSVLVTRFTGTKALEWVRKFTSAFYAMEMRLLDEQNNKKDTTWLTQREQGKLVRLTAMDTVKDFVEYATTQGSENAKFYYKNITSACYRCLNLIEAKKPKLRDTLDTLELHQLMMAEIVAERSIRKHMEAGEHYKAVFSLVKLDLERFADSLIIGYQQKIAA